MRILQGPLREARSCVTHPCSSPDALINVAPVYDIYVNQHRWVPNRRVARTRHEYHPARHGRHRNTLDPLPTS